MKQTPITPTHTRTTTQQQTPQQINITRLPVSCRDMLWANLRAIDPPALLRYTWDNGDPLGIAIDRQLEPYREMLRNYDAGKLERQSNTEGGL